MTRLTGTSLTLGISLAVHAAAGGAFTQSFKAQEARLEQVRLEQRLARERDRLQFEFVESPVKTLPQSPEKPRKTSDRDSLAQDLEGAGPDAAPKTRDSGLTDQLEQVRREGPAVPVPSPEERVAVPRRDASASSQEQPKSEASAQAGKQEASDFPAPRVKPAPPQIAREATPPPAPQGLTGNDRITTQEMSRAPSKGTRLRGQVSFEATGSGMGVYMKNLKEKIWLAWFPYLAFNYPTDFRGADAVLKISIDRSGRVRQVSIHESGGSQLFASYCVEAVQRAGDFGPLPEEILALLGKDELEILFGFHYR